MIASGSEARVCVAMPAGLGVDELMANALDVDSSRMINTALAAQDQIERQLARHHDIARRQSDFISAASGRSRGDRP